MVFGYVFVLITFIASLYALHVKENGQHMAAFLYAGGALGVTFAGDLVYASIFSGKSWPWHRFIWCWRAELTVRGRPHFDISCGIFLVGSACWQVLSCMFPQGEPPEFTYIGLSDLASWLIFIGFCLNAAVFPFHAWLPDAYPQSTVTGAVFLSASDHQKRGLYSGQDVSGNRILMWAGAFMTCFPIFYAVIANDMRRVLAYSLINQVGFMICGIGIGTQLAINGVVAHAFCHIIYKALLFMSTGAVLHMTGKIRATDLGGLHKTMPYTAVCCMIGAASISAFPLFSGFISKSLTLAAVAEEHQVLVWFMLLFASAGVFHHAGIKVPFFIFFGHDSGIRAKEPPLHMRTAMGMAALICIFLGVYPAPLYNILPYPVDFVPYTAFHVVGMLQLLMFGALAFTLLILSGLLSA